ncbi:MAG: acyl-CoA dehydrogenase family protein [Aeromicrobium sp.]
MGKGSQLAALRREVREFLRVTPFESRCDSWMRGFDLEFSRAVAERGWIGMAWPKSHGGGDRSYLERLVVSEELLRAGAPVTAHWTADRQIGPSIIRLGTEELQRELLPVIRRAEAVFCVGLSESDAGSDLAALRTRAERVPGGWELSGSKLWTTSAHVATHAYVLARTSKSENKHDGLSEFVVDMDSDGVAVRPIRDLAGEHHFNEVFFDSVFVPEGRLLGTEGQGWRQATQHLAFERGGCERYLSTYLLFSRLVEIGRTACDRSLNEALGRLTAQLTALRRLSWDLAIALDAGHAPVRQAAGLKLMGTLFEAEVVDIARYAFSACHVTREDLALLRQAQAVVPATSIRGGASDVMRAVIAKAECVG